MHHLTWRHPRTNMLSRNIAKQQNINSSNAFADAHRDFSRVWTPLQRTERDGAQQRQINFPHHAIWMRLIAER
jgi:hypothetical protein